MLKKIIAGFVILMAVIIVKDMYVRAPADVAAQAVRNACGVSDIAVDKLRARTDPETGYTHVTGRLTNHCSVAVGPQVKITAYNKAGDILAVDDIWPASIRNIPANAEYPFEWLDRVDGFRTFTVSVIDVKQW